MLYNIPVNKLENLEKIINRYNKKGANITFNIDNDVVEKGTLIVVDNIHHCQYDTSIDVACKEVFVEGTYRINGWSFVGTIEFTELGNIIRLVDSSFEGKVPTKYLHTPRICEHCGTIRNRKDTYLICSDEGEWKQVGSSCLLEYTQGLDADTCASIMSCLNQVKELSNFDCDRDSFLGNGFDSTGYGMSRKSVLPIAYAYVKQYGYQRMENGNGTAHDVLVMLWNGMHDEEMVKRYESLVMPSEEELAKVDAFAQEHINDEFGYMRNASLAWLNSSIEYRDFSLVSSFVNTYFKEVEKVSKIAQKQASINNQWVGNINDRVTIKVASYRCLFSSSIEVAWHTYANSYTYEIIDEEGHVFIWKSSKNIDMKVVDDEFIYVKPLEIVATIKSHDTYKGINQTRVSNGKVTKFDLLK